MRARSEPVVLVVDGDAASREAVRDALSPEWRVAEAGTAAAGLEAVRQAPVDLVLLDVRLPDMHGYEACQRLKEASEGAFLPVVFLSALGSQADRNAEFRAGADDYLAKPIDPAELRLRAAVLLHLRRQDLTIREQSARLQSLIGLREEMTELLIHDINNPLSAATGLLGVLRQEVPLPLRADVEAAALSTRRVHDLLEDLLAVNLIDSGKLALKRHLQPVSPICERAVRSVEGLARQQGVNVSVLRENEPVSNVDDRLLQRAMENLLANAYHYSPRDGEVEVMVRAREVWCLIDVADHGPGVPDTLKDVLFQKFGSVEAQRGDSRRGHGLGLHFVRRVAEVHGGLVTALDRPDGGSIFRLSLLAGS